MPNRGPIPAAPLKILKWLGREDAPLLFRLRADPRQWAWGLRFLIECLPVAHPAQYADHPAAGAVQPGDAAGAAPRNGISYDHLEKGILHIHSDEQELRNGARVAST